MVTLVSDLLDHIRISDLLDIALVTGLFYVLASWLRDRATQSVGLVVCGLFLLFMLARSFDLYLTTLAFEYGTVVIMVALAIVFQQDIRHGFERLASVALLRRQQPATEVETWLETVAEAICRMASSHVGALIVFPGREPLERHLRGGVEVDAKISLPLLLSIFHPKSPGHDGAVLIEDGRIVSLGLHLPLSKQVELLREGGTRHAAALGLVQRSDAMVIAVSEERGTITLAGAGTLSIVDPQDVVLALSSRLACTSPVRAAQASILNWSRLAASLSAAAVLWFTFANATDVVQRTFVVPIEYRNIPAGFEIAQPRVNSVEVTLSGSEPAFQLLDLTTAMVSIDASACVDRQQVVFQVSDHLRRLPSDLEVASVRPESILVSLQKKSP